MFRTIAGLLKSMRTRYSAGGYQPFVILFTARTGSNLLASKLDMHPEILCHPEVFNKLGPHRSLSAKSGELVLSLGTAQTRNADLGAFLRLVFSTPGRWADGRSNTVRAIGCKVEPVTNLLPTLAVLFNRDVKKIVLNREDLLAVFVSTQMAERNRRWIALDPAEKAQATTPVHVDIGAFRNFRRRRTLLYGLLRGLLRITGQPWTEIEFKQIGSADAMRRLLGFLAVSQDFELAERTRRQNPEPLADRIANLDEVIRAFGEAVLAPSAAKLRPS